MKRFNLTNKIYLFFLIALIIGTIVKILSYKGWDRYYYSASFSAPSSYPIYVRDGYFVMPNGEIKSISTALTNYRTGNWGDNDYQSSTTKERLPEKLVLQYASYRDRLFFTDTIALPADAIKKAFAEVATNGIETSGYSMEPPKALDFVVGIANKGNIIVWLRGKNKETILLKHQIKPHEPVGDETYHAGRLSKKEYLEKVFSIDSTTRAAFDKGLDLHANYIDTPSGFKKSLH